MSRGVKPVEVRIKVDVLQLDWNRLAERCTAQYGYTFRAILMNPPWDIRAGLRYDLMEDWQIFSLPIRNIQYEGFLFVWVVNQKESSMRKWIEQDLRY